MDTILNSDAVISFIVCATIVCVIWRSLSAYKDTRTKQQEVPDSTKHDLGKEAEKSRLFKDEQQFLDFCYKMAESTNEQNKEIKTECWEYLKNRYAGNPNLKAKQNKA